jgi:hypothetical protein
VLNALLFIFYSFSNTVDKFLIKKSLIPRYSSSIQDKHDDYNSRPNFFILQDSCIIIIIIIFSNVIFKFCNEHPKIFF